MTPNLDFAVCNCDILNTK